MSKANPNRVRAEVRVMWPGGPSRKWSPVKCTEAHDFYEDPRDATLRGYTGSYVCQGCGVPTVGVQRLGEEYKGLPVWVCGPCRDAESANKVRRGAAA